jgi:hypothetical protein
MWDTLETADVVPLSHDMPCPYCGHGAHRYLPCSETCRCTPPVRTHSDAGARGRMWEQSEDLTRISISTS